MMKLPFNTKAKDQVKELPSVIFSKYCAEELERRRDAGKAVDEQRFQAAVALALERLRQEEEP